MAIALKMIIGGLIIGFASWLAGKKPELAGFITALPLVSIIAIAMTYIDHKDLDISAQYAKSIIVAVPVSWLFFIPFFFAHTIPYGFWGAWGIGLTLLCAGYFIHQAVLKLIL